MNVAGTVQTESDKKVFALEELTPVVVEENAIGLEGIVDGAATGVFFLQGNGFFIKGNAHQAGFAALPCKGEFRGILRFAILANVLLECRIAHAMLRAGFIEGFFFQVKAIPAAKVAVGAGGLGHEVKWWEGVGHGLLCCVDRG